MQKKDTKDIELADDKKLEEDTKKKTKVTKKATTKKASPTTSKTTAKKATSKAKKENEKEEEKKAKATTKAAVKKVTKKATTSKEDEPKKKTTKTAEKKETATKVEKAPAKKVAKKATTSKEAEPKEKTTKTVAKKETATKVEKAPAKKVAKKATTSKEAEPKEKTTKTAAKKETATKVEKAPAKKVAKKATTKKTTKKSTTSSKTKTISKKKSSKKAKRTIKSAKTMIVQNQYLRKNIEILEYFDLPYRYNETTVKVLAQTPKILFVYWDISDYDRDQYKLNYGENFFDETYPVLLVKNETYGYVQEVPVNDFANSWYLHINDPRSKYSVELGRKYKNRPIEESPYIYVKDSNQIIAPNDHILFEELKPLVKYKNAKTHEITFKNITNVLKDGKIIDFYSLYQLIYNVQDLNEFFNLDNPSSGNPTSTFK